jgi:site-specific recombinase XerD
MSQELTTIVTSTGLDVLILGWIDAKARKSGSARTRQTYTDTLAQFRAGLQRQGLDLDSGQEIGRDKDHDASKAVRERRDLALSAIALTAQAFSSFSARGRQVSAATINQRLAILSSFYDYALRQVALEVNPIGRVERAKIEAYKSAQPLSNEEVTAALAAIDRETLPGKRDYAALTLMFQTGRRLAEIQALELAHLALRSGKITVTFERCKGGKTMLDTLPYSVSNRLLEWLQAFYGDDIEIGAPGDQRPVWVNLAHSGHGQPLGTQSIADICQKRLGVSKVHVTRHTWAHSMDEAGASAATIQARLGHESLATTGRYLAQLKRAENPFSDKLAAGFGIE